MNTFNAAMWRQEIDNVGMSNCEEAADGTVDVGAEYNVPEVAGQKKNDLAPPRLYLFVFVP
jgi:hypothetical protein